MFLIKTNKYQNAGKSDELMKVKQRNLLVLKHLQHPVWYSCRNSWVRKDAALCTKIMQLSSSLSALCSLKQTSKGIDLTAQPALRICSP